MELLRIDHAITSRKFPEEQILGDRQIVDQVELLHDHSDTGAMRVQNRIWLIGTAEPLHIAAVGCRYAAYDIAKGCLARAVSAHQRMHFPSGQVQVGIIQHRGRIAFRQPGDLQER